jgi:hypothetical protein
VLKGVLSSKGQGRGIDTHKLLNSEKFTTVYSGSKFHGMCWGVGGLLASENFGKKQGILAL